MYIKFSEKFALRKKNLIETEGKNHEKSIFGKYFGKSGHGVLRIGTPPKKVGPLTLIRCVCGATVAPPER